MARSTPNRINQPIDSVGHDIGALITIRLARAYNVPLRSLILDVATFRPNAVWPERVHQLQTPGLGEDLLRKMREADPRTLTAPSLGHPE